ncbi:MAG: hypothetical protein ACRD4Y_18295 [Candidatus Acidiferrales bacterium]
MNRETDSVDDGPDDGFRQSDYPTRPLLFGGSLHLALKQMPWTSNVQRVSETEDGFRPSDYPTRPVVCPGQIQVKLNAPRQQQISVQETEKNRSDRGNSKKLPLDSVYIVEASKIEAVLAGRPG